MRLRCPSTTQAGTGLPADRSRFSILARTSGDRVKPQSEALRWNPYQKTPAAAR